MTGRWISCWTSFWMYYFSRLSLFKIVYKSLHQINSYNMTATHTNTAIYKLQITTTKPKKKKQSYLDCVVKLKFMHMRKDKFQIRHVQTAAAGNKQQQQCWEENFKNVNEIYETHKRTDNTNKMQHWQRTTKRKQQYKYEYQYKIIKIRKQNTIKMKWNIFKTTVRCVCTCGLGITLHALTSVSSLKTVIPTTTIETLAMEMIQI